MTHLHTTHGPKTKHELGFMLPHEHVFVDLGIVDRPGFGRADARDVIALMRPQLVAAKAQGITSLIECTPVGVGRRVDIVKAVADAADLPIVVATGIYREPWVPQWAHDASEDELRDWMMRELEHGIDEAPNVHAGFIKLSAGDDSITDCEARILRAAARAAKHTGAVIGSHTIRGRVVRDQLDIIEACGYTAERFIWIHASAEPDFELNLEMARRGAWIEYDWIGGQHDALIVERIVRMLDANLGHRLLLSQDRGWFDPSKPNGGVPQPYTYLAEIFLPKLRAAGVDEATIHTTICDNPFSAFAR